MRPQHRWWTAPARAVLWAGLVVALRWPRVTALLTGLLFVALVLAVYTAIGGLRVRG